MFGWQTLTLVQQCVREWVNERPLKCFGELWRSLKAPHKRSPNNSKVISAIYAHLLLAIQHLLFLSVYGGQAADRVHSRATIPNQSQTLDWSLQLVSALRLGLSMDGTKASDTNCEPTEVSSWLRRFRFIIHSERLKFIFLYCKFLAGKFKAFTELAGKKKQIYIFSLQVVLSGALRVLWWIFARGWKMERNASEFFKFGVTRHNSKRLVSKWLPKSPCWWYELIQKE